MFLNVALVFGHCISNLWKALFLIVYLSLPTSTSLLMTSTLVRGLNTTLSKIADQILILLVNFSMILLHFRLSIEGIAGFYW